MKKKVFIIIIILLCIYCALIILGGFKKRTDVTLVDYSLSEDGTKMQLNVTVENSIGYIRNLKVKQGGDNKYITFYSTFGILNSKIGAKTKYEIELNPTCEEIYFYKGDGGYNLVLKKNTITNQWQAV